MSDLERDSLPLPDYDHHTVGSLQSHVRSLGAQEVETLLSYEREHGARVPMLNVLERRLESLWDGSVQTDGTQPAGPGPETAGDGQGGSKVDPSTAGPPVNPPSHGDPTNPAQPRT